MPWQPTSLHYPSVIVTPAWGQWQQHMRKMKMLMESQDGDVTWCLNPRVPESVANARILHPRPGNLVVMMAPLHREYSSPGSHWPLSDHPPPLNGPFECWGNTEEDLQRSWSANMLHALVTRRSGKFCLFLDVKLITLWSDPECQDLHDPVTTISAVIIRRISTFISRQLRHKKRLLTMAGGRPQWFIGLICLLGWSK